ncbi:proline racemase family protein [Paraburkholderia phosphatilytica]|uniref:proline racemase family protein n=1 Tax=Paraburkholderia phosphatilytica TaxID=2282883 RepID=UPI000E52F5DC|nr:proline racemase family protein [Paraburkholderia phosphatilytica]
MLFQDTFDVIYTHTEGEPLCIIHSGIQYPADSTILEKRQFIEANYDWLRLGLMREPRGHKDMVGVFVTPPSSPEFDAGLIYIDATQYQYMCGHGTIAIAMAMVSLGMVPRNKTGNTMIRFETLAGPVTAEVGCDGEKAVWTRFENVPAYVAATNVPIELPELGALHADVIYGGNYFAAIDLRGTTLRIAPETGKALIHYGILARDQLREKLRIQHPSMSHVNDMGFVTFYHEPTLPGALYKNVHVFGVGQLDRSPGGTATSAMMALLESKGQLGFHQPILTEGLLGSGTFEGCLLGETTLNGIRAVRPTVKGTASILGTARWTFDRRDVVGKGFIVA